MESTLLAPNEMIGPYRIVRKIGHGGMGEVYEAYEENLQRRIAIKILSREATSRPDIVSRFKIEGRVLAKLEHTNIVRIHALGEYKDQVYMAMEYVDGWTLDEYLRSRYFGLHEILRLARTMLEGLAVAHAAGVIHRDIKPQNVMVDRQLNTKLLDFGVAKLAEDTGGIKTVAGTMFGTLNYIAPEIFNGAPATKQSDIYSLGLVLYMMFTGKSPFVAKTRLEIIEKVANSRITFPPEARTILPNSLKNIILRMTAKNLHDRYQNVRDVLTDLAKVNLNALPTDLRPALASHMNIECPSDLRAKCAEIGLEYLEIRLVVCLAAEITLKSQNWTGQDHIKIDTHALTEAARRYVFAKRQMVVKNAYSDSGFRTAVFGLVAVLAFAAYILFTYVDPEKSMASSETKQMLATSTPPAAAAPAAPALAKPEPTPVVVAPVTPASSATPSESVSSSITPSEGLTAPASASPTSAAVKTEAKTTPDLPKEVPAETTATTKAPIVEARSDAKSIAPDEPAKPAAKPVKTASVVKASKKAKVTKKKVVRTPAAMVAAPVAKESAEESLPDFLQQKPVLLPTVIERRGSRTSQ